MFDLTELVERVNRLERLPRRQPERPPIGQTPGWLPFCTYGVLPLNCTTDASYPFIATLSRDCVLRSWHMAATINSTNNGTNYWTFTLRYQGGATITTLDTSGMSAGVTTMLSTTGLSTQLYVANIAVEIKADKTGSPGAYYLGSPAVYVS